MKEQPKTKLNFKHKMKNPAKTWVRNSLRYEKFYVDEIATVNLSKTYLLKNAKKTRKPNNRDLKSCQWIASDKSSLLTKVLFLLDSGFQVIYSVFYSFGGSIPCYNCLKAEDASGQILLWLLVCFL